MRKTNCLLFIPPNSKFFDFTKTKGGDIALLTLEEKIKRDPTQRERLRCEAKFSGTIKPSKKKSRRRMEDVSIPEQSMEESFDLSGGEESFGEYDDEKIVGISGLQPMVVYAKIKDKDEMAGFPGFFDERNQIFMMAEVGPVSANNFNEVFKSFLESVAKRKKEKTEMGGELDEKN